MTTLALDAMGGDHAPDCAVLGAAALSLEERAPDVVLVGDTARIEALLAATPHDGARLRVAHAPEVVAMDDEPRRALEEKPRASIVVAAELVRDGEADALV